jgi:hypothetical protein
MAKINKKILQFFSSLSDETRLKIILSLSESPKNVGDIHKVLGEKQITLPGVSHQLKLLESSGVVAFERRGREKIFRLADGFCWCIVKDAFNNFSSGKKLKSSESCGCKGCCSNKSTGKYKK